MLPTLSEADHDSPGSPQLSLWDAICLIVGIIIGASIYQTPPQIFRNTSGPLMGMIAWGIGGAVSLVGALCYSELASAYRGAGGDYTYLTRAYGRRVGFFFAWAELAVIRTGGSIAYMAFVFANYADEFQSLGDHSKLKYAIAGILFLTLVNALGVRLGRWVQNGLTIANIVGLGCIAVIGLVWFFFPAPGLTAEQKTAVDSAACIAAMADPLARAGTASTFGLLPEGNSSSFALTMVLVFYAYGGWNEAAFIACEVKEPRRNVRRALIYGTLLVTVIYILVNLAYLGALGYWGVCTSKRVAADMFALPFGDDGRKAISLLVMCSALGSVNGLLFTGMRLYGTFGSEHRIFSWLAGRGDRPHVAYGALFAQAFFSLLLIGVVEMSTRWRGFLGTIGQEWNIPALTNLQPGGHIDQLVTCAAPVFWLFFFLTATSLFILRIKEPERERPFRVPLYPYLPAVFAASCLFMLYRSAAYALEQEPAEAFIVLGLMLLAAPLILISGRQGGADCAAPA